MKLRYQIIGIVSTIIAISVSAMIASAAPPPGQTTAPYTISYSGKLTSGGNPVTTTQTMRFSIWTDDDVDAGDFTGGGAVNTGAAGYAGWNEEQTVTPDSTGLFHLRLGSIVTLPSLTDSTHKYLQVEVKPVGSPITSYEVMDPDGNTANVNDRHPLNSSAFTINADMVDNRDAGTGPGQIPFLDALSKLPISTIPGGTNGDTFILDFDDTVASPAPITLQFGNTLNKTLTYDTLNTWFHFNDDVDIGGNLTITGTLNGAPVGLYSQTSVYEPEYADGVYEGDGASNNGTLQIFYDDVDGTPGNNNFNNYKWTTNQTSLQDFDIIARVQVPESFTSLQGVPLTFVYKTDTALAADNVVDVTIEDTAGNPVTITGGSALTSATFATTGITFTGAPTFTPGQQFTIKIKLAAKNTGAAYAGRCTFNYNGR
jgi:hypothetical protein